MAVVTSLNVALVAGGADDPLLPANECQLWLVPIGAAFHPYGARGGFHLLFCLSYGLAGGFQFPTPVRLSFSEAVTLTSQRSCDPQGLIE